MLGQKRKTGSSDSPWAKIFSDYNLSNHNFEKGPYYITAEQIKSSTREFSTTGQREVRILCKQDTRDKRPQVFKDRGLFILPVKNGQYAILKGEGYIDVPEINSNMVCYSSKLDYELITSQVGNSEMQHLDFAYATSLLRTFLKDESLVLTIRGRKYTPKFSFRVGSQKLKVESVQTEVDAGYEGRDKLVLVEAKNKKSKDTIIRQLYYPFRQWQTYTSKQVYTIFFEQNESVYSIWQFGFAEVDDYNSIQLIKSGRYKINQ